MAYGHHIGRCSRETLQHREVRLSWDAVQAVGEIAAAVGVLISLVYLAAQVRESAERTSADTILRYTTDVNTTRQALWAR